MKVIEEVSIAGETEMHSYSSLNKSDQLLSCRVRHSDTPSWAEICAIRN